MIYQEKNRKKITKDGRSWYFRTYYVDIYGNKKQKQSKLFKTSREAKDKEREFLNNVDTNLVNTTNLTIKELKKDYLNYQKDRLRISSYESTRIELSYTDILDNIKVKDLNIKHINNWKNYINEKNFSIGYKNTIYRKLRALLNYGNKFYDLNINVLNKMENFSDKSELKKEMLFYTKEEFKDFIKNETDLKWICFFNTLFFCGLRQGEALALNWKDIDFKNGTMNINKSLCNRIKGEKYLILPTKTKGSNRKIPIPKNLLIKLNNLYNNMKKYENFNEDWFVFGNIFPLATTTIQKRRDKLVMISGVKRIRIHDFRHSCASLLISSGANITLIARFLGHQNISTTLNVYSHFYKSDLSELINNIDNDF